MLPFLNRLCVRIFAIAIAYLLVRAALKLEPGMPAFMMLACSFYLVIGTIASIKLR